MFATIRGASPEDFDEVFDLVLELRDHLGSRKPLRKDAIRSTFDLYACSENHYVYVSESAGRVVGLMTLSILVSLYEDRPYIAVDELIVAADCRGNGIGKRLLDVAFARAAERDCCEVCIDVDASNEGERGSLPPGSGR